MHDFSPITCELSCEVQATQMLVIVVEHNIHLISIISQRIALYFIIQTLKYYKTHIEL